MSQPSPRGLRGLRVRSGLCAELRRRRCPPFTPHTAAAATVTWRPDGLQTVPSRMDGPDLCLAPGRLHYRNFEGTTFHLPNACTYSLVGTEKCRLRVRGPSRGGCTASVATSTGNLQQPRPRPALHPCPDASYPAATKDKSPDTAPVAFRVSPAACWRPATHACRRSPSSRPLWSTWAVPSGTTKCSVACLQAYVAACQTAGASVQPWRAPGLCSLQLPYGGGLWHHRWTPRLYCKVLVGPKGAMALRASPVLRGCLRVSCGDYNELRRMT
nr:uncharacterized protein LOC116154966 [Camelus dromedarius]